MFIFFLSFVVLSSSHNSSPGIFYAHKFPEYEYDPDPVLPVMAMAGKVTIAEVEELVEPGELDPDHIHTPGIYVHRIFQGKDYEKRIEQRTIRKK